LGGAQIAAVARVEGGIAFLAANNCACALRKLRRKISFPPGFSQGLDSY